MIRQNVRYRYLLLKLQACLHTPLCYGFGQMDEYSKQNQRKER